MKFLIVGIGSIGARHSRIIKNAGGHELALCDANEEDMRRLAGELGIEECYGCYHEAISQCGAQAVVVCTPNSLHFPVTIEALKAGCHVLCEKPMASSAADARAMLETAETSGKVLMIGYTLRMSEALCEVKRFLDSGRLGRTVSARVVLAAPETLVCAKSDYRKSYETGGGIIYDYSHELDFCRLYFGEAKRCVCFKGLCLKHGKTADDNADMIVEYENSTTVQLHMDYIQEKGAGAGHHNIGIVCEKGYIECNFKRLVVSEYNGNVTTIDYAFDRDDLFSRQLSVFLNLCEGHKAMHVSAQDGYQLMRLCEALYRSAANGSVEAL